MGVQQQQFMSTMNMTCGSARRRPGTEAAPEARPGPEAAPHANPKSLDCLQKSAHVFHTVGVKGRRAEFSRISLIQDACLDF